MLILRFSHSVSLSLGAVPAPKKVEPEVKVELTEAESKVVKRMENKEWKNHKSWSEDLLADGPLQLVTFSAFNSASQPLTLSLSHTHTGHASVHSHNHTLTHSHTILITCTCCYDLTKGPQDKDFSYSFSDSLTHTLTYTLSAHSQ